MQDKDYIDYTATLNAHETANIRDFVEKTYASTQNINSRTPMPFSAKVNNYSLESPQPGLQTRNGSSTNLRSFTPGCLLETKKFSNNPYAQEQGGRLFLKPSLIESRVAESPDTFNKLGEGFKKLFLDNNASQMVTRGGLSSQKLIPPPAFAAYAGGGSPKPIVIPIAGYGGHRKGETSENLFGKCFRDVSIKSKIIERGALQRRN